MSQSNIAVGDIVRLKSGGPDMSVESLSASGYANCVWATADGQVERHGFPVVCLAKGKSLIGTTVVSVEILEAPHV